MPDPWPVDKLRLLFESAFEQGKSGRTQSASTTGLDHQLRAAIPELLAVGVSDRSLAATLIGSGLGRPHLPVSSKTAYGADMTYPNHYLLQFGGTRATPGEEIWTCTIRMLPVPVDATYPVADVQAYLEDVCAVALQEWMQRPATLIASTTRLAFAKLNRINSQGAYADPTTVQYFYASPWPGGATGTGTAAMVPQASLAVTWETDTVSRGLASRGRIYQPSPCVTPSLATGLFDITAAEGVAASAATLIGDLRGGGGAGSMVPNIVSDSGAGVAHRIDKVTVDTRVDIIRKRAGSLHPIRSAPAVV